MMPTREIVLRRWHLLLLLAVFTLWSVAYTVWSDNRIDTAEQRISRNATISAAALVKAEHAQIENRIQDRLRAERVAEFRRVAIDHCRELEAIKERIRATVRVNEAEFRLSLESLNIDPDSPQGMALFERARQNEAEALERFKAEDCRALPNS
jgi:hypothetical protein